MADFLLDTATGDLDFTGDQLSTTTTFADSLRQRLTVRLKLFQGEYDFDLTAGIDYYGQVLRKGVTKEFLDNFFILKIEETEGVEILQDFSSEMKTSARSYTMTFTVLATDGSSVELTL